jgi:hypothetical protein
MDNWQALRIALGREADSIFASSGEIVSLSRDLDPNANRLWIKSGGNEMKLEYDAERKAVRWEKATEYGYDRISCPRERNDRMPSLA